MEKLLWTLSITALFTGTVTITAMAESVAGEAHGNIKGIQMVDMDSSESARTLGCGHAAWNVRINDSGDVLKGNQDILRRTKSYGMKNTIKIHNPWHTDEPNLMPAEEPTGAVFYGYNVRTEEGRSATRRAAARIARIYGGLADNWIIGNEVNEPNSWYYMSSVGNLNDYTADVATAFRIWYEEIKKVDANANVYIPFDYRWKWYTDQGQSYQAKDMIQILNTQLKDTDYGIAWHPYPEELNDPNFLNDPDAKETGTAFNSPIINMKNISELTRFFEQSDYLAPSGAVRHIILSEQGFNCTSEEEQAHFIQQAYERAAANPHIEAFILSNDMDIPGEMWAGNEMHYGLRTTGRTRRKAYDLYRSLN